MCRHEKIEYAVITVEIVALNNLEPKLPSYFTGCDDARAANITQNSLFTVNVTER